MNHENQPHRSVANRSAVTADVAGVIGLTLCPGKKDPSRGWNRDLDIDVAAIRDWGAKVAVSLIEESEFELLEVTGLSIGQYGMRSVHLPIRDVSVPDRNFEVQWVTIGADLRGVVRTGGRVLHHCRGGLGRAGMIAARLLVEFGMEPGEAIHAVRHVRPGAIQPHEQERYVMAGRPIIEVAE
jgi:ADP-ribosyl-[dinitrogen reductase] hydrolase